MQIPDSSFTYLFHNQPLQITEQFLYILEFQILNMIWFVVVIFFQDVVDFSEYTVLPCSYATPS
jgi:hypothetical protein